MNRFLRLLLLSIFAVSITNYAYDDMYVARHKTEKLVRGSTGWGFFAEFLWALNHIHYCMTHHKIPVIYWSSSFSYYSSTGYNGSTNCWEYYFEPVSPHAYYPGDPIHTPIFYQHDNNFSTLWDYVQYVQNLHLLSSADEVKAVKLSNYNFLYNGTYPVGQHLYNKNFRKYVKQGILDPYVRIKKPIQNTINNFYAQNMHGKRTIGLHLRGKFIGNESPYVETTIFLNYVNQHFADGRTQFFVSTDQKHLLEEARRVLNGKVIAYESQRFDTTTSPIAGQEKLHPILGENVLIEAVLLSLCDHIVHGLSNVSTAALYFNPNVSHTLLY
jgi:hypothetical protein